MRVHLDLVGALWGNELEGNAAKELQAPVCGGEDAGGIIREVPIAIEVNVKSLLALIPGEGHEGVRVTPQPQHTPKHTRPGIHWLFAEACGALDAYLPGERREIHFAVLQVCDGRRRRRLGAHNGLPSAGEGQI